MVRFTFRRLTMALILLAMSACGTAPTAPAPSRTSTASASVGPSGPGTSTVPNGTSPSGATSAVPTGGTPSARPTGSPTTAPPRPSGCPAPYAGLIGRAPGEGRTVALTFDDGPTPVDLEIAAILRRYQVTATFFHTGANAKAHPDIVHTLAADGFLIAGHSWDHRYPRQVTGGWTVPFLVDQWSRTRSLLRRLSRQPVCFLRPPGGFQVNVVASANSLGLTPVLWSVDTLDWRQPSSLTPEATAAIVKAATAIGSQRHPVVLLHSGKASHESAAAVGSFRGNTVAALPAIIAWYQAHGYTFVALDGRT